MLSTMTHRERLLAAIAHKETDRVPMDYWGVGEITQKLYNHFGVDTYMGLAQALDLDKAMGVGPKPKTPEVDGFWHIPQKQVPLPDGSGFYSEPLSFPLAGFETIDEIEAGYKWPDPDDYDYSGIKAECQRIRDAGYAVEGGYISLTYFYEITRGTEQMCVDFASDPDLAEYMLYKLQQSGGVFAHRILEAGDGLIDITQVTDDFGCQSGLMISKAMVDRYLGRYYDENVAFAKRFGASVFHHDDGAIMDIVPWVVEKGCEILNPLQWRLPGWNLPELKSRWGKRLCFHGGIDNQFVMPFGTAEDVRQEVRTCVDTLWRPDRTGYILAPCHNIQAITPLENVLTMYNYCKEYGK